MSNKLKSLIVGVVSLLAIFLLFFGIKFLKGQNPFKNDRVFHAFYQDIAGLTEGNSVTLKGYKVGTVTHISFNPERDNEYKEPLSIEGKGNFILLLGVIIAVLLSGFWKPDLSDITIHGVFLTIPNIMRDVSLLLLTLISWRITDLKIRNENGFTWFPILEVAKLFAGIFITIIPAIAILRAGQNGVMGGIINMVTDSDGNPVNIMYFWLTGVLSSFLDNAPTYLVFFNIAGSNAPEGVEIADYLMNGIPGTLLAISLGAVFMGAMTYIGNAPNFMVKSIAEENDIAMPSFFGFMLWSILILIPVFIIVSLIMI